MSVKNERFEVTTQEDPETGDLLVPMPPELLKALDWKEGDELQLDFDDKGRLIIRKV